MYLAQALHRNVQSMGDFPATIDGSRSRRWRAFQDRVARFAGALQALGLQAGDRVGMLARNGDHFRLCLWHRLGGWGDQLGQPALGTR